MSDEVGRNYENERNLENQRNLDFEGHRLTGREDSDADAEGELDRNHGRNIPAQDEGDSDDFEAHRFVTDATERNMRNLRNL